MAGNPAWVSASTRWSARWRLANRPTLTRYSSPEGAETEAVAADDGASGSARPGNASAGAEGSAGSTGGASVADRTDAPTTPALTSTNTARATAVRLSHVRKSFCRYVSERTSLGQSVVTLRVCAAVLASRFGAVFG